MISSSFKDTLQGIEEELASVYGFLIEVSARDCLVDSDIAIATAGENRAALLLRQSPNQEEVQLGLYFRPELMATLESLDPFKKLDSENLDAFCVAVEEVSHFHLVSNRAQINQGVSLVELEWQGEIDKWLLAVSILQKQTGNPHLPQLTRLIFDGSICYTTRDQQLYEDAHRLAARYCYKLLPQLQHQPLKKRAGKLKEACRITYSQHWAGKLKTIENL